MATIDDVARLAGVSRSTVSYALSGKRRISASTRTRIELAIAELNYQPHAGARALASAKTQTLGLVVPLREDVDVNVIMQFVTGAVTRAREHNHDMLLLTEAEERVIARVGTGSRVDGLILMDVESDDPRIPSAKALRQPTVLIGLPEDAQGLSCIDFDFEAAARLACSHLTQQGHQNIALLGPPQTVVDRRTSYATRLIRGFESEARSNGITPHIFLAQSPAPSPHDQLRSVLSQVPDLTALIIHNEAALPGILRACFDGGLRIPDDLAVVVICPTTVATGQQIPLTALEIPGVEIGRRAVDMVMERLGHDRPQETRLFTPALVDRGSTAAPGRSA